MLNPILAEEVSQSVGTTVALLVGAGAIILNLLVSLKTLLDKPKGKETVTKEDLKNATDNIQRDIGSIEIRVDKKKDIDDLKSRMDESKKDRDEIRFKLEQHRDLISKTIVRDDLKSMEDRFTALESKVVQSQIRMEEVQRLITNDMHQNIAKLNRNISTMEKTLLMEMRKPSSSKDQGDEE